MGSAAGDATDESSVVVVAAAAAGEDEIVVPAGRVLGRASWSVQSTSAASCPLQSQGTVSRCTARVHC